AAVIASRIIFTAKSASFVTSCGKRAASRPINSDLVMTERDISGLVQFGLEQGTEVGRAAAGRSIIGSQLLHRLVLLDLILGLDREVDRTRLAIDVDDQGLDLITFLE